MALQDLTNPINLPNGIDTANANPVAKAEKVVVTGTNESVTDALGGKEASLGNPLTNGQVLASQTDGTRSWVTPSGSGTTPDISSLESKVNALFPLTPDVDILTDWSDIFDPLHGAATVDIVDGYSLIADYRSASDKYESTGVTYGTGTDIVTYTGLTGNLHRSFGFAVSQVTDTTLSGTSGTANITIDSTAYLVTFSTDLTTTASNFVTTHSTALNTAGITVTANAGVLRFVANVPSVSFDIGAAVNATGDLAGTSANVALDKTLMWITDGGTNIPFVDIVSAGNIRVNNYVPAETTSDVVTNQFHFLTRTAGSEEVSTAPGSLSTFTITNFPTGATETSRSLQVGVDVYVNGVDTSGEHLQQLTLPATNTAQAQQTFVANVQLGPLHGNRTVTVTVGYEYRVDGANLLVDLTLESAPSDVTINFSRDTAVTLNYTAQSTVARVDRWVTLTDAGGDYTFSGTLQFILSMRPVIGGDGEQTGFLEVVPAATFGTSGTITQLNDGDVAIPTPLWNAIAVADDVEFRTFAADHYFRHSEIAGFLGHRNEKWAYGIARLQTNNAGHSITEAVDLASGSTINGVAISTQKAESVVYEGTGLGTGAGELVTSVALPANYGDYAYVHITEYDVASLQFRHSEIPTYIFTSGLVLSNHNVRLQGNTVMSWTAGTRTLAMNPSAQEILRVSLKD